MHDSASLLRSPLLAAIGFTGFFTTRLGGVSQPPFDSFNFGHDIGDDATSVEANMDHLIQAAGLSSRPHQARQVHGCDHLECRGQGIIQPQQADILISAEAGCPVAVRTADCLPVLLADPHSRLVAAVHAGWRGSADRIVMRAVERLVELGADVQTIHASLGPSIGRCCFEIGEDTAARLAASIDGAASAIDRQQQRPHADLVAINTMQLIGSGVKADRIESLSECTFCHAATFFSYRRDGAATGRHLGVVASPAAH